MVDCIAWQFGFCTRRRFRCIMEWDAIFCAPLLVFDMFNVKVALVMVDPAGTADRSNLIAPRRISLEPWLVWPT